MNSKRRKTTNNSNRFQPDLSISARKTTKDLLWSSSSGTVFCSYFLCLENFFPTFSFNFSPLFFCWLVYESNFVFHFLHIFSLLLLQLFLLTINWMLKHYTLVISFLATQPPIQFGGNTWFVFIIPPFMFIIIFKRQTIESKCNNSCWVYMCE